MHLYPCSSRDLIRAACATVEKRPFQGRVTKEEDGLQPWWSSLETPASATISTRAKAHIKNRLTQRYSATIPKKRPDLNDRAHAMSSLQKNNFTPNVMLRIPPLNSFLLRKFGSNGNAYPGVVVAVVTPALLNTLPLLKL